MSETSTYPFPQRQSEIALTSSFSDIEPLMLNSTERQELVEFESRLYERIEPILEIEIEKHVIYPEAFLTEEGRRVFAAFYLDTSLDEQVEPSDDEKETKDKWNNLFDEIVETAKDGKKWQEYADERGLPRLGAIDEYLVVRLFREADLTRIPAEVRRRLNDYSLSRARTAFLQAFKEAGGDVSKIEDPRRIARLVQPEKLSQKARGLREFKRELKQTRRSLLGEESIVEGKGFILDIYQRFINTKIADLYEDARVSFEQTQGTQAEEALSHFRGFGGDWRDVNEGKLMQRIDRFLEGVGLSDYGTIISINKVVEDYYDERKKLKAEKKPDDEILDKVLGPEELVRIGNLVLRVSGIDGWKFAVAPTGKTLRVNAKDKEIKVPQNSQRSLISALAGIASELAHVWRVEEKKAAFIGKFRLFDKYGTGRQGALAEGSDRYFRSYVEERLRGGSEGALPYYYLLLKAKSEGMSFKGCFVFTFGERAWRAGKEFDEALNDQDMLDSNYSSTLRIFRRATPLNDYSGFIPDSRQLNYLEGEIVAKLLFDKGFGRLMFLSGVDLYSVRDLSRLGMLDLKSIREPDFLFIDKVFNPVIQGLRQGRRLNSILEELEA